MQWDDEYKQKYNDIIKNKLPTSFVSMYEKNNWLHDWYLKNFYIANTGRFIQAYSKKGSSTFQMELCTSNNDINILIIYENIKNLHIDFSESNDVGFCSPTGFGRCLVNTFEIGGVDTFKHNLLFEGDNKISLRFNKINYKKIINNYWR